MIASRHSKRCTVLIKVGGWGTVIWTQTFTVVIYVSSGVNFVRDSTSLMFILHNCWTWYKVTSMTYSRSASSQSTGHKDEYSLFRAKSRPGGEFAPNVSFVPITDTLSHTCRDNSYNLPLVIYRASSCLALPLSLVYCRTYVCSCVHILHRLQEKGPIN